MGAEQCSNCLSSSLCPCCHPFVRCHYDTSCYNGAFRFCGCFHCGAFRLCGCLYFCGTRRRLYEHGHCHCHCVCDTIPTCSSHAIGFSDAPCWSFYWSSSPHPTFASGLCHGNNHSSSST